MNLRANTWVYPYICTQVHHHRSSSFIIGHHSIHHQRSSSSSFIIHHHRAAHRSSTFIINIHTSHTYIFESARRHKLPTLRLGPGVWRAVGLPNDLCAPPTAQVREFVAPPPLLAERVRTAAWHGRDFSPALPRMVSPTPDFWSERTRLPGSLTTLINPRWARPHQCPIR